MDFNLIDLLHYRPASQMADNMEGAVGTLVLAQVEVEESSALR